LFRAAARAYPPRVESQLSDLNEAARATGQQILVVNARTEGGDGKINPQLKVFSS
jgi:hypothetical protein